MESLHNLIGPTQSMLILVGIALILIFLIVKAIQQGSKQPPPTSGSEREASPPFEPVAPSNTLTQLSEAEPTAISNITKESNLVTCKPNIFVTEASDVPQDSVLRRHYLAEQTAKKAALSNPIPTDSILRRHYDVLHQMPMVATQPKKISSIEQAIGKENGIVFVVSEVEKPKPSSAHNPGYVGKTMKLPEDSVLKRHFVNQLQNEIQSGYSSRPTDSVLRRHYDHLIKLELEKRLMVELFGNG